ncbi:McrC family protein [Flavihumibacter profundi]|uniref:McrC family protein n=1 Tax=Flavihumibacter profundi TaxID=2716883 RepID=UPI001CC505DC|nr:restriction endonuclease [Flavihumibacter profundi]MBZ5857572.1 restriction endonuclease [Flavihumibacter profundi]
MALLFEYGKWESTKNKSALNQMLKDIWMQRLFVAIDSELTEDQIDNHYQPFLQFDDYQIRANNFVGFIQNGDEIIEIYPKVFREHFQNPSESEKMLMLRHIFYWFSYCRKWNFPFSQASLDTFDIEDFPELIINLIANQFLEIVSKQPLTMYQQQEEALVTPRGSINFKRYIAKSLSYGNYQAIECNYEQFLFDNTVNRVIKYCTRLLMKQTKFSENLRMLQEVVFILDEVEDLYCTNTDIDKISLNTFFDNYSKLLHSCKLILSQQLYSNNPYELSQWCLLFPMEYIFEDFLAGFLENKFSKDWNVEYQKSDEYLSNVPKVFNMQHDIFLTSRHGEKRKIIVDTKYKLRQANFKTDPKKGVSQTDLYQMVSYALKRGCTDILLVYPNISANINPPDKFEIISGFSGADTIIIRAIEIPFSSLTDFPGLEAKLFDVLERNLTSIHDDSFNNKTDS